MDTLRTDFVKDIDAISEYVLFLENLNTDLEHDSNSFRYYKTTQRRKFQYSSTIISLYGIVEKYTGLIICRYIEKIESIYTAYNQVNEKIKEKHFDLSIQLLSKVLDKRLKKYNSINKDSIVTNLYNCLNGNKGYQFNKEAFILHSGNIHHEKICGYLKDLNIDVDRKIQDVLIADDDQNQINTLEDLVNRRNEIAHGAYYDYLAASEMNFKIYFVKKYFNVLMDILEDDCSKNYNEYTVKYNSIKLDIVEKYSSSIIAISKQDADTYKLKVNDAIFIRREDVIKQVKILELRRSDNGVTMKIDGNIKENSDFFISTKVLEGDS